ncbi:DMT family transporter [Hyalangium minutum]|uniref:Permease of the drug/metabolite transporter (DMT) protein n=1 Tax=Hyalangium minutum TaxID=394096 RepID=A0A085W5L2_9BACT|nr:DMT family transporter [Hyalangium minutum]KFE62975.1 Permease of the drug/metabolite transporter (DMT) protein [Hyalangium minutum]
MAVSPRVRGALMGLGAAALFGVSAPVAKRLLPSSGPLVLASLLYLGSGLGLSALGLLRRRSGTSSREAPLGRKDVPLLAGIILCGGVLGPVLMLTGLGRLSGVAASLMLNLEGPLTLLLALLVFGEHLGRSGLLAAGFIFSGAVVLGVEAGEVHGDALGALCLAGACLAWAVDNNLTQRLSLKDPVALVRVKALGAGACTLVLALLTGQSWPPAPVIAAALVLGLGSYGLSIVLDTHALRLLGAAREAAYFATAPFVGALVAVPLLDERFQVLEWVAGALMAAGVLLLLRERHVHVHTHTALEHEHLHVHDAHHQHEHPGMTRVSEPHSHPHRHVPITHDHPHVSDLHHRHQH